MASAALVPTLIDDPASFYNEARFQGHCQVTGEVGDDWHAHHGVYKKHCRRRGMGEFDPRNALRVTTKAHADHHARIRVIRTVELLDCNLECAVEGMGAIRAATYFRRYYDDQTQPDPRLEALCPAI